MSQLQTCVRSTMLANRFATLSFVLPFSLGGIAAGISGMTIGPVIGWRGMYLVATLGFPIALR